MSPKQTSPVLVRSSSKTNGIKEEQDDQDLFAGTCSNVQ